MSAVRDRNTVRHRDLHRVMGRAGSLPDEPRNSNFDWLRYLFAGFVVLNHFGLRQMASIPMVAAFVTISGFLIPTSFEQSRNWGHFAWKRLLRVGPVFILAVLLVLCLFGPAAVPPTLRGYYTMYLGGEGPTRDNVLWSLMLEELLYAFHALSRRAGIWSLKGATGCFVLSLALWMGLTLGHIHTLGVRNLGFYWCPISCFFLGNVLGFLKPQMGRVPTSIAIAGWIALLVALPFTNLYTVINAVLAIAFCGLTILIAVRAPRLPHLTMDLSYSCYALHLPILMWFHDILRFPPHKAYFITVPVLFLTCLLSWNLIEKPALSLKSWRWKKEDNLPTEPYLAGAELP